MEYLTESSLVLLTINCLCICGENDEEVISEKEIVDKVMALQQLLGNELDVHAAAVQGTNQRTWTSIKKHVDIKVNNHH